MGFICLSYDNFPMLNGAWNGRAGVLFVFFVWAAAVALASCSGPQPPPFKPVVDVKLLMQSVIDPSADVIWQSVETIISASGIEEKRPRSDEEWSHVRNGAVMLTESGNLLMMVPRAYDGGDWMRMSRGLIETAEKALQASQAKNIDALLNSGEQIDKACEACHQEYAYENSPKRKR
jgi:hypothetical protein